MTTRMTPRKNGMQWTQRWRRHGTVPKNSKGIKF